MKKLKKRNQVVIAALALMIVVAGYLSYGGYEQLTSGSDSADGDVMSIHNTDSENLDTADALEEGITQPGEAVLTGATGFAAQAKVNREQIRSQNKEMLTEVINNESLSEEERQDAVATMVEMTEISEKEAAAEMMLEAKGFSDVVVNLTGDTADVMVPSSQLDDTQRAQIEDIIIRKTEVAGENIVITPMDESM